MRLVFDLDKERADARGSSSAARCCAKRKKSEHRRRRRGRDRSGAARRAAKPSASWRGRARRARSFKPVKQFGFDADDAGRGPRARRGHPVLRRCRPSTTTSPSTRAAPISIFGPAAAPSERASSSERDGDDEGLTVLDQPAHRRGQIERGAIELPEPRSDGEVHRARGRRLTERDRAASRCSRCWWPSPFSGSA